MRAIVIIQRIVEVITDTDEDMDALVETLEEEYPQFGLVVHVQDEDDDLGVIH